MPVSRSSHPLRNQILPLVTGVLLVWTICLAAWPALAGGSPEILRIRFFSGPDKTRVVLDLDRSASFEVREISDPHRLVINLPRCTFANSASLGVGDDFIKRIRCNPGQSRAQVVLDLKGIVDFKTFSLPPQSNRPHRVVLDVMRSGEVPRAAPPVVSDPVEETIEDLIFTIVIDPGHGGLDPGAVRGKIREKDVVLDVSLELARLLNSLPGYRAVLTRDGDYYPSLGRRVEMAAEFHGDLFLSVHCNTHKRKQVGGMEVYFLSLQGATDREAQELAHKENAADLVGLDSVERYDDLVVNILMDMRMTMVLHDSARLAEKLLQTVDASAVVKKRKAKQAGFQVLRSLAMPSALVEIAYLSNADDMKVLSSHEGRDQLAAVLAEGVVAWRHDQPALALLKTGGPDHWPRQYAVRQGDSLWGLARSCGTTIQEITQRNQLQSGALLVGQVLRLPQGNEEP